MQIRQLTEQDNPDLLNAINSAFADYIVPFQLNVAQLQFKMMSENILPEWSLGIFETDRMIAFIMHGVRTVEGKTVVYNAGTGVLPEYRGQGLVGKMYDYIQPFFKENGVHQVILEVIESNQSAIRAYEKDGFSIRRKLLCFGGELQTKPRLCTSTSVERLQEFLWEAFQSFWDISPSWQSAVPSMDVVKPAALGAFIDSELVGYVLFNPVNKRIYQIAVAPPYRRKGIGTQLLAKVQQQLSNEKVQINNMDEAAESLKLFLEKQGLTNDINQFEMVKHLL
ncbi:MAG: GNAT family N-acetyltransferase [Pedobacter sp.]|uniref:GNAT family N-acetyltransferase n=1 Tax=Pedobacter sp. TaxID=1411316 RepID=UPI00356918B5